MSGLTSILLDNRPVVSCVLDGRYVVTECVAVDVVRARAGHRVARYAERDDVLMLSAVLVAFVGDADESGGIDVEGKLFGPCAFLCRLVSFKSGVGFVPMEFRVVPRKE